MTKAQIAWARMHDWFLQTDGKGVWVRDEAMLDGICLTAPDKYFSEFSALRDWAGY